MIHAAAREADIKLLCSGPSHSLGLFVCQFERLL